MSPETEEKVVLYSTYFVRLVFFTLLTFCLSYTIVMMLNSYCQCNGYE